MTAKTSTQRAQDLRKRREADGLKEVRGIWAPTERHDAIKQAVRELEAKLQRLTSARQVNNS